jgi:hypothetical protein
LPSQPKDEIVEHGASAEETGASPLEDEVEPFADKVDDHSFAVHLLFTRIQPQD